MEKGKQEVNFFGYRSNPNKNSVPTQVLKDIEEMNNKNNPSYVRDNYKMKLMDIAMYIKNSVDDYDRENKFRKK